MPHASIKLVPGVNTQETPTLNETSGIQFSSLIRFFYDVNGIALVQKLGGWAAFFTAHLPGYVAALWAWQDLDIVAHLAIATESVGSSAPTAQLSVLTGSTQQIITPTYTLSAPPLVVQTPGGVATVQVNDPNFQGILFGAFFGAGGEYYSVDIQTQIAIGSVVLFGQYPITTAFGGEYFFTPVDILGNPVIPIASSAPVLPTFTTTLLSAIVTVELPGYSYALGTTFPILIETVVGGIALYGNYIINSLIDSSHFTITAATPATSAVTVTLNNGLPVYVYSNLGNGGTPPPANFITAQDWTLDNFGQDLIACAVQQQGQTSNYQPIYQWTPGTPFATVIAQAPTVNDGILVAMPQRQIMAWGSTETGIQDPLLISWCDVSNFNSWIPLVTNQAGNYRIPKGSRIVGGLQGPQQTLFWTDVDVWVAQYIGPPYVYSFNEVGSGCGLIARHAAAAANGVIYWMGPSQFFTLSANGVQPLPCPVWDVVFQNLDGNFAFNIRVAVNSRFNEITWFFTSLSGETTYNDSYVKYNFLLNVWDYAIGAMGRTAWIDQSIFGPPIGADPVSKLLMQHDSPGVNDANGAAMVSNFRTGNFAIAEGDFNSFVDLVWPDMKWGTYGAAQTANVQITFYVSQYPGDTPVAYGPYTVTQATQYFNTRFRGRLMSVEIGSSDVGSFWRIGNIRYRYAPDGKFS